MPGLPRDLVERLYAAPPDGFVAARSEAVAAARAAGDPSAAREIAKLRKPTVAAWLVNLLALRRPELMADLVELSAALRSAQRELRGDRLRELSVRRRGVVGALVGQARALAEQEEPIPCFLYRAANAWEYVGEFRVAELSEDPDEVAEWARIAEREEDVSMVLHLEAAD